MISFPTPAWLLRWAERRERGAWWRLPPEIREREPRRVALTLDDGPSEYFTLDVLRVLREENVRATFFVLGDRCQAFPGVLRKIAKEGHGLGLHGDTHLAFTSKQSRSWAERLAENQRVIEEILGADLAAIAVQPYFRPPFGKFRAEWEMERQIVNCSILPGRLTYFPSGWVEPPILVRDQVERELHPGAIIALHCGQRLAGSRGTHLRDGVYDAPLAGQCVRSVCQVVRAEGYELDRLP